MGWQKHVVIATNLFSPLIILLRELIKSNVAAEHEFDDFGRTEAPVKASASLSQ